MVSVVGHSIWRSIIPLGLEIVHDCVGTRRHGGILLYTYFCSQMLQVSFIVFLSWLARAHVFFPRRWHA